jgi:hypothetical protein
MTILDGALRKLIMPPLTLRSRILKLLSASPARNQHIFYFLAYLSNGTDQA